MKKKTYLFPFIKNNLEKNYNKKNKKAINNIS